MKKAVVLLSGGLDSTTCLVKAISDGYETYAISFDYGQKQVAELEAAKRIAKHHKAKEHKIIKLSIGELGGSALTDDNISVPNYDASGQIPVTYVPARNTVFLSIALGYAEVLHADAIYIGVSEVDYSGYPDCRQKYIDAFQAMANLATKQGVEGEPIAIKTPLIQLNKAETIKLGTQLSVDYSMTVSCYRANAKEQACGTCESCTLRKQGFLAAGLEDPTRYVV